ncbi:MAG TPA: adenylosuccinate synthase [Ignavibacteria bacterium]|nr:adenylosuccinate synthase [Ignavibacteria bacterium]
MSEKANNVNVIVGLNWGDEGKGRMVDYLAQNVDYVVRYQGGNNAGHTVVNEFGTFKLHLVPSGIFNPNVTNVLGTGMVIDLEAMDEELTSLRESGINVDNIVVSDRASITFPFHRIEDELEEERLGNQAFGSTKRGIAYAYSERYLKKSILIGELIFPEEFERRLKELVDWKNLLIKNLYGREDKMISFDEALEWSKKYSEKVIPHITDVTVLLENAVKEDKKILFEAQLGSLRDIYYGIYPFTTSSCTLAAFAPIGGGLLTTKIDKTIGVMKAFSTCVGAGPFVTEISGEDADNLRETAFEYGASTGRPRRIGHFDAVASRYGAKVQGVDEIAITKLDSLSGRKKLYICTAYEADGKEYQNFPLNPILDKSKPIYIEMPGWTEDINGCRKFEELPKTAQDYVNKIEELVGYTIKYISVGPERESLIIK